MEASVEHRTQDTDGHPARRHRQRVRPGDGHTERLREATQVLCTSAATRAIDVGRLRDLGQAETSDRYFVQRLYVGIEPEEQTSRELKDRYGVFGYLVNVASMPATQRRSTTAPTSMARPSSSTPNGLRHQLGDDGDRPEDHPDLCDR